ncbi:MAG: LysE family transporter [Bacteroidia bacterium]|nr:LysE family transporter [Bacteroidia bacterium]
MILVLAEGIFYGLILTMLIGPVFFALIRTSIEKGFRSGAYLALGIAISDASVAILVYFGISQLTESELFQTLLGLLGGILMMIFGIMPFLRPVKRKNTSLHERCVAPGAYATYWKGYCSTS